MSNPTKLGETIGTLDEANSWAASTMINDLQYVTYDKNTNKMTRYNVFGSTKPELSSTSEIYFQGNFYILNLILFNKNQ